MAAISTIIMAGGLGTRMRSPLPKVLHELCGLPMLAWVVRRRARGGRRRRRASWPGRETAEPIAAALPGRPRRRPVAGQRHRPRGRGRTRGGAGRRRARRRALGRHAADRARDGPPRDRRPARGGAGGALVSARARAPARLRPRRARRRRDVARIVEARDATPRRARARRVQRRALLLPRRRARGRAAAADGRRTRRASST